MSETNDEAALIAELQQIEYHYGVISTSSAGTPRDRIMNRLREIERTEPSVEFRFSLPDDSMRRLFLAMARRYGMQPYRHHGQRRASVMVRAPKFFMESIFNPEFCRATKALQTHLDGVTRRVIAQAIGESSADACHCGSVLTHVDCAQETGS